MYKNRHNKENCSVHNQKNRCLCVILVVVCVCSTTTFLSFFLSSTTLPKKKCAFLLVRAAFRSAQLSTLPTEATVSSMFAIENLRFYALDPLGVFLVKTFWAFLTLQQIWLLCELLTCSVRRRLQSGWWIIRLFAASQNLPFLWLRMVLYIFAVVVLFSCPNKSCLYHFDSAMQPLNKILFTHVHFTEHHFGYMWWVAADFTETF